MIRGAVLILRSVLQELCAPTLTKPDATIDIRFVVLVTTSAAMPRRFLRNSISGGSGTVAT